MEPERPSPPWAEKLVRFLDDGITVPGTKLRVGYDGVLGLVFPGVGDAVTAVSSLSLFYLALQRGVPRSVLARMAVNVAIDALVGAVPVVGDLFDFGWKASRRNLRLIEQATAEPTRRRTASDYLVVGLFVAAVALVIAAPIVLAGMLLALLI